MTAEPPPLRLPDFSDRALCAETDPEAFFPQKGGSTRRAKRIRGKCPVQAECLEWALTNHEAGIWGGTSENERRRMRPGRPLPKSLAQRTPPKRRPIPHGSPAGYAAHYRRKEMPVCDPCYQAHLEAKAARKKRAS